MSDAGPLSRAPESYLHPAANAVITAEVPPPEASPDASSGGQSSDAGWLRRLIGYCLRYRRTVLLAFGGSLGAVALNAVTPLIVRQVIDNVIMAAKEPLLPWILALLAIGVARFGLGYLRRYYGAGSRSMSSMRCELRFSRPCSGWTGPSRMICRPARW